MAVRSSLGRTAFFMREPEKKRNVLMAIVPGKSSRSGIAF
jgi:hypothetical protein